MGLRDLLDWPFSKCFRWGGPNFFRTREHEDRVKVFNCPECNAEMDLLRLGVHLGDTHKGWNRKKIEAWMKSQGV